MYECRLGLWPRNQDIEAKRLDANCKKIWQPGTPILLLKQGMVDADIYLPSNMQCNKKAHGTEGGIWRDRLNAMGNRRPKVSKACLWRKDTLASRSLESLHCWLCHVTISPTNGINHTTLPGQLCIWNLWNIHKSQLGVAIIDTDLDKGVCCLWQTVM